MSPKIILGSMCGTKVKITPINHLMDFHGVYYAQHACMNIVYPYTVSKLT